MNPLINEPLIFWFIFGRWFGIILSAIFIWWAFLDVFRRSKLGRWAYQRLLWPGIALLGLIIQVPAFIAYINVTTHSSYLSRNCQLWAIVGMVGCGICALSLLSFFSKPTSDGHTFYGSTADFTGSTSATERRRRKNVNGMVAPIPPGTKSRKNKPEISFSKTNTSNTAGEPTIMTNATEETVDGAYAPLASDGTIADNDMAGEQSRTVLTDSSKTILEDFEEIDCIDGNGRLEATVAEESPAARTMDDEPSTMGTVVSDPASDNTIIDEKINLARTICDFDNPNATVLEDSPDLLSKIASLVIIDGETSSIEFTPSKHTFIVGRDPNQSNFAVNDSKVSRMHFSIEPGKAGYVLRDLKSSNGTFINGEVVTSPVRLKNGDVIEFGRITAQFEYAED